MAYLRRYGYRRRNGYTRYRKRYPFKKVLKRYRPRRRPRRPTGTVVIKANRVVTVTLGNGPTRLVFNPSFDDFEEFKAFQPSYESYQFLSCKIRVRPNFNQVDGGNPLPPYVIAPWHKPILDATTITINSALSIDRHKMVQAHRIGTMKFTPSVHSSTIGENATTGVEYRYRPKQIIQPANQNNIPQDCGFVVWPQLPLPDVEDVYTYTVEYEVYCKFYNQKINIS